MISDLAFVELKKSKKGSHFYEAKIKPLINKSYIWPSALSFQKSSLDKALESGHKGQRKRVVKASKSDTEGSWESIQIEFLIFQIKYLNELIF